jgi:hypothetical protein
MSKNIMKNVRYDKFNNYCVNSKGKDLKDTKMKNQSLNSCLANCAKNHTKCSGVEYYAKKRKGTKCFHILQGLTDKAAAKGSSAKRFRDAVCYVRS